MICLDRAVEVATVAVSNVVSVVGGLTLRVIFGFLGPEIASTVLSVVCGGGLTLKMILGFLGAMVDSDRAVASTILSAAFRLVPCVDCRAGSAGDAHRRGASCISLSVELAM